MRQLTTTTAPDEFVGAYGPTWRPGVLSEHLDLFVRAGGKVLTTGSGRTWAFVGTGAAAPVVCSEIVRVDTEDGPISGRCGEPATVEGACAHHAALRAEIVADDAAWEVYA